MPFWWETNLILEFWGGGVGWVGGGTDFSYNLATYDAFCNTPHLGKKKSILSMQCRAKCCWELKWEMGMLYYAAVP